MFEAVDHVVISVPDLDTGVAQYEEILGTKVSRQGEPPGAGFKNAYFDFADNCIELVSPTSEDGPVSKHVARTGGGMYLLALRVDDVAETVSALRTKGVPLSGDPGEGNPIQCQVFVHPKAAGGGLVQITAGSP